MLKVEEKQYHETRRIESKSPTRLHNVTHKQLDNNLDYLLEDLQNSISRPEPITDTRSNSLNRITSLRPANPITEFSSDDSFSRVSADGAKNIKTVKKETYTYQSTGGTGGTAPYENSRIRNNINELDSLLDDLQQVKQSSDNYKLNDGQNYSEYSKSKVISGKTVVENVYPVQDTSVTTRTYTSRNIDGDDSITSTENRYLNEGTYGNIKTRSSATPPPSKTSSLSRQTKITNVHTYPIEVVETTTPEMNTDILASLDPNLLPSGNTKVTTTIKTYTYEIPGSVYPSPNTTVETEKYVYSPNQSQSTPSKSFVYNKYENNSSQQNINYKNDSQYRSIENTSTIRPPPSPPLQDRTVLKETLTSRNYQPGNTFTDNYGKQTYVYNESTVTKNTTDYPHREPGPNDNIVPRETYPVVKPPPPPLSGNPPHDYGHGHSVTAVYNEKVTTHKDSNYYDDTRNRPPQNVSYKYRNETSYDENKPLLHYPGPGRFPTDPNDAPPKKLDELMATIGQEPPNSQLNAGYNAHEIELMQQKKVDTLKQQQKEVDEKDQKKLQRTKNVTGPPVYYPPGHEMFSSKSESSGGGGGWKAEGAMYKESGKYKYEAESGSQTKVKTKAAVVPICLPLCCGLPCTIL